MSASSGSNPSIVYNSYTHGSSGTTLSYTFTSSGNYRVTASVFTSTKNGTHVNFYCNASITSSVNNMWSASDRDWGGSNWYGGIGDYSPGSALLFAGTVKASANNKVIVRCRETDGYLQLFVEKLNY